ncbi:MAG TPA: hypothetical protein VHK86_04565, partial [Nitrososphaera sp.]|nr:hypothetical protein [Nitrososphaera sp.]
NASLDRLAIQVLKQIIFEGEIKMGTKAAFAAVAAAATVVVGGIGAAIHYVPKIGTSEGDRVGTVVKLSHKGILCKSWEGQMAMDNFRAGSNGKASSNSFEFSVDSAAVVDQLQKDLDSGVRVKLHYQQTASAEFCGDKSSYHITKVTELNGQSATTSLKP